jgi:hypothetical protein
MYASLKENGYINYSRFVISEKPRETIRLANTAYTALKAMGIDEPWRNIALLQGEFWASTMIRKGPFTRKEIEALREFAVSEGFRGLIFHPYQSNNLQGSNNSKMSAQMVADFETLLRGSISEREALIENYRHNLKPSTDDMPFFFNYFRLSKFFESWGSKRDSFFSEYLPDFPVGHMILLSSLMMISVAAFVLIILPLRFLTRYEIERGTKVRAFLYFAALGMGFMFIEISMMQRFILFLGHPVYSMSVVLAGILAFAGFGALFSSRITLANRPTILRLLTIIAALSLFNALCLEHILAPMLSLSLSYRIIIALLLLAPTAFVLGMPFPLGIRMLEKRGPQLIPWGWAINGFLSVLSSILATVLAMAVGFTWVLLAAGFVYVIGLSFAPVESAAS